MAMRLRNKARVHSRGARRREAYVRQHFGQDWKDYRLYHLVLNSSIGTEQAVKMARLGCHRFRSNSEPGNDEVSGRSHGNQVKLSVDSILNVHTWLPDGALASVAQDFSCEGAGAVYAFVARDAKMEILVS
jgi:hypothetical protein